MLMVQPVSYHGTSSISDGREYIYSRSIMLVTFHSLSTRILLVCKLVN